MVFVTFMVDYYIDGWLFVVNENIYSFNPLSLSPYPLLQWRRGNRFIRDSIILTPVGPQRLLGESTVIYIFLPRTSVNFK